MKHQNHRSAWDHAELLWQQVTRKPEPPVVPAGGSQVIDVRTARLRKLRLAREGAERTAAAKSGRPDLNWILDLGRHLDALYAPPTETSGELDELVRSVAARIAK